MAITKEQLIKYFTEENNNFNFVEFFSDDDFDKRAIIIITNNQIIKSRNILVKNGKESSGHDITYDYLTRLLYNIMFSKNGEMILDEKLMKDNEDAIDYLQYQQNIMIRMCNEGVNHLKLIWVHIPLKITLQQFLFLKKLNEETKFLFEKINKSISNINEDYLVGFIDKNDNKITGDSLECVIEYIRNNNIIENNSYIIIEEYIIGDVLENNKRKI